MKRKKKLSNQLKITSLMHFNFNFKTKRVVVSDPTCRIVYPIEGMTRLVALSNAEKELQTIPKLVAVF